LVQKGWMYCLSLFINLLFIYLNILKTWWWLFEALLMYDLISVWLSIIYLLSVSHCLKLFNNAQAFVWAVNWSLKNILYIKLGLASWHKFLKIIHLYCKCIISIFYLLNYIRLFICLFVICLKSHLAYQFVVNLYFIISRWSTP
jgi:hypothetical protein